MQYNYLVRKNFFRLTKLLILIFIFASLVGQADGNGIRIEPPIKATTIKEFIILIIRGIRNIAAILAPIVFIVASILYATSAGNQERLQKAKDFTIYAIIGIVIILIAEAIVVTIESFF